MSLWRKRLSLSALLHVVSGRRPLSLSALQRYTTPFTSHTLSHNPFATRHIGPSEQEQNDMLRTCGVQSMEELISKTIPNDIRLTKSLKNFKPLSEFELSKRVEEIASKNDMYRSYLGQGYYDCIVPPIIKRNILENPGWITQYTPYQTELAQGRLESLMNFQTMVADLTGLDVANASLLDEATAAAEAMSLCYRNVNRKKNTFFVDANVHDHSLAVLKTRAEFLDINIVVGNYSDYQFTDDVFGAIVQYPNSIGTIEDYTKFIKKANEAKVPVAMATDLLALTLLKTPGELGASIAFGNAQRFGVPLGCGGPHAAFFAVKNELKKIIPGRLVGLTWDSNGLPTYRLALQTREQFIRRGKATSNICTAQALLANMSAMYGVYHGPHGLKDIATRVHTATLILSTGLRELGHAVKDGVVFDTIKVTANGNPDSVLHRAEEKKINLRQFSNGEFGVSLDETVTVSDLCDLLFVFGGTHTEDDVHELASKTSDGTISGSDFERTSSFLKHPIFNSYHSETELLRYIKRLENLDLSLAHSMIPLGSCTMKLNPTSTLLPVSMPEFSSLHPYIPSSQCVGYQEMLDELESHLCDVTGYDKFSFQPNSGAQGEYAGLCVIMAYLKDNGHTQKNICLVPASAHGTNPASAAMAGLNIVEVPTNKEGEVSIEAFRSKIEDAGTKLAAVMITYPSTSGVFEDNIREVCDMVHHYGGQVYVDGANLNAQIGLCRVADYGGDVSHLNLHKTFCIPHGGGGPGMGPIGVKSHLAPYLPSHPISGPRPEKSFGTVSAAAWGSASILPISWAYILMMGSEGLKKASEVAVLNANYMAYRLKDHYKIMFQGSQGFNAHEFILDTRDYKATAEVEAVDIAKRLQDYGFHAPTISWPVGNTMMIEPTECESKAELDRYCDALISIRKEIAEIECGKYSKKDNVFKNAPHSMYVVTGSNWVYPYSREKAAFPAAWLTSKTKLWPGGGRANDVHGDKYLVPTLYEDLVPLK